MLNMQQSLLSPSTMVFLAIPKTAGSTFTSIIEANYTPFECFSFHTPRKQSCQKLMSMKKRDKKNLRMIKGHWPMGLHEIFPNVRYITFLRDPIRRYVSEYNYILNHPNFSACQVIKKERLTLRQAVENRVGVLTDNMQTRWCTLGGLDIDRHLTADDGRNAWRELESRNSLVGFVELFDESVLMCASELKWKTPLYYQRNVSKRSFATLTQDDEEWLKEHSQADYALMECAKKDFATRWSRWTEANPKGLETFRRLNARNSRWTRCEYTVRYIAWRLVWKALGRW